MFSKSKSPEGFLNPPPFAREFSLLMDEHRRPRNTTWERKQGHLVAATISVPDWGKTPPVSMGGQHSSPFELPPQPSSGTLASGCPGKLGRGAYFRALYGNIGGVKRHTGTCMCVECACVCVCVHAHIHDGSRHVIHLCVYALEPSPGCRATCSDSGV